MNPNLFENLNSPDLWSSITMMNDVEYTPIQIHNMTGYHTPEVEQPSCDYCLDNFMLKKLMWNGESNCEVMSGEMEVEHFDIVEKAYHYTKFEIKFCPMCGKRLETNQ